MVGFYQPTCFFLLLYCCGTVINVTPLFVFFIFSLCYVSYFILLCYSPWRMKYFWLSDMDELFLCVSCWDMEFILIYYCTKVWKMIIKIKSKTKIFFLVVYCFHKFEHKELNTSHSLSLWPGTIHHSGGNMIILEYKSWKSMLLGLLTTLWECLNKDETWSFLL